MAADKVKKKDRLKVNGVIHDIDSCQFFGGGHYRCLINGVYHVLCQSIVASWGTVNRMNTTNYIFERVKEDE
jgi:hypothetical protein